MVFLSLTDWFGDESLMVDMLSIAVVLGAALLALILARKYTGKAFSRLTGKTSTDIDDLIISKVIVARLIYVIPVLIVNTFSFVFLDASDIVHKVTNALISLIVLLSIASSIDVITTLYVRSRFSEKMPIKTHIQLFKIFIYVMGTVTILGQLTGRSPWYFITGVGVFTAIILLIFRNTLLSFVAGLQIVSSDLIREGDWIEVPKYGADGSVIDISLHTVSVQNWDKTITSIPTYKFMEESFKNWRGMSESGGRRIKRALYIDISTIRLCDETMLERFGNMHLLKEYITLKLREVGDYNRDHDLDMEEIVNGRRLTNVGTFRAYIQSYLKNNQSIHTDLTFLVRQLPPGPNGLPIEIYVFTNDTNWIKYEGVQADIFDHLLAVAPEFGLRIFQNPSGKDFSQLAGGIQSR